MKIVRLGLTASIIFLFLLFSFMSTEAAEDITASGSAGTNAASDSQPQTGGASFSSPPQPSIPTGYPGFGQLIALILTWAFRIVGISVFLMVFIAGLQWFMAGSNPGAYDQARKRVTNAATGAVFLFAAYVILYTINPDLVKGTFSLPGIVAEKAVVTPIPAGTACKKSFSNSPAAGCQNTSQCLNISSYTSSRGCESNDGVCLASPQTAAKVKKLVDLYLASDASCSIKIASSLQVNGGPSKSSCHKPGNPNSGTCVDFNISPHPKCYLNFYSAAEKAGAVSFIDEYVCKVDTTTGGNIHVNF